jgi:hypothetical protein
MPAQTVGERRLCVGVTLRWTQALLLGLKRTMLHVQSRVLSVQLGVDHGIFPGEDQSDWPALFVCLSRKWYRYGTLACRIRTVHF